MSGPSSSTSWSTAAFSASGAAADRHVDDAAGEFGPVVLGEVVAAELLAGVVDDLAELLVADLLDRGAEDAEFRHQLRLEEAQHPRQQLPFGEVAGGTEDDDQVRRQPLDDPRVHFFGDVLLFLAVRVGTRCDFVDQRRCGYPASPVVTASADADGEPAGSANQACQGRRERGEGSALLVRDPTRATEDTGRRRFAGASLSCRSPPGPRCRARPPRRRAPSGAARRAGRGPARGRRPR